jgi:hypothetical protein
MDNVKERGLERQGKRIGRSGGRLALLGLLVAIPGIVLVVIDDAWSIAVGITILLFAYVPFAIGCALLVSSAVSRWSARHKSFA